MRPVKLTVSAFGPYSDKTVIEMDKLGNNGIYLITGDTGAGKTTIFDAITFALYGEASGVLRDSSMLRSKYASPDTQTYVEMEFIHKGKMYTIKRNPAYARPKLRGEGMADEKADACLTMDDGRVITKQNAVNEEIINLIGVDKNRFTQIVMIAQGDFLKLLISPTKEREQIFRQIFKTDKFFNIQENLKQKFNSATNEHLEISRDIVKDIKSIEISKDSHFYESFVSLTEDETAISVSDVLCLLEKYTAEEEALRDTKSKEKEKILKDTDRLNTILGKAQTAKKAKSDMDAAQKFIDENESVLKELKSKLKESEKSDKAIDKITGEIKLLEEKLPMYDKSDEIKLQKEKTEKECTHLTQQALKKKSEYEAVLSDLDKMNNELKKFSESESRYLKLQLELSEVKNKTEITASILQLFSELKRANAEYKTAQSVYLKSSDKMNESLNLYNDSLHIFLNTQAGIIAKTLEDGKPCPVCGSTTHPQKAKSAENSISQIQLDALKKAYDASRDDALRDSKTASEAKARTDALTKTLKKNAPGKTEADIKSEYNDLNEKIKALSAYLVLEKENSEKFHTLQNEIPEKENFRAEIQKLISEYEKDLARLTETLKNLTEKEKEILSGLEFSSKKDAINYIQKKTNEKNTLINEKEAIKKAYENLNTEIETKRGQIKILRSQKHADYDTEELNSELKALKIVLSDTEKEIGQINIRLASNKKAVTQILQKSESIEESENRIKVLKAVSDTANGKLTGREKITFETFVQMTYFERIIERANIRLLNMSSGQYELKRSQNARTMSQKSGLELSVVDHYNGTVRDVKTLSGGEAFKASLSLALGLSEEIQQMSGGIELDTMFIDEGFGSLDEDSLNRSVSALMQLSEDNKIVGIISHVQDLKTRIDKKIIVTKSRDKGSRVTIEI